MSDEMNVEAFIEQAAKFDTETKKLAARLLRIGADQVMSHPYPVVRVSELVKWSKSGEYLGLLRRAKSLATYVATSERT